MRGTDDHPRLGDGGLAHRLGDAEVGELHLTGGRDHDVAGLDVAVHEAEVVGRLQCAGGLLEHVEGVLLRQARGASQHLRQCLAADELHDQVGQRLRGVLGDVAVVVDLRDVRVLDTRGHLRLGAEPSHELGVPGELRVQDLDGDVAVEHVVVGFPDAAHAARCDVSGQAVASADDRSDIQVHCPPPRSAPSTSRPMGPATVAPTVSLVIPGPLSMHTATATSLPGTNAMYHV